MIGCYWSIPCNLLCYTLYIYSIHCIYTVFIVYYLISLCSSYVGRKSLNPEIEKFVKGATHLVKPTYSYWTLGYMLSSRGAKKFLAARPFDNLLPVDEYFPIMYNEHSE